MKTVATLVAALGLTTTFAGGAFAAQHEMDLTTTNCAEYLTMDEETQIDDLQIFVPMPVDELDLIDEPTMGSDTPIRRRG